MKPDVEELRKKYMKNPPEGMTSEDIRHMSGDDLLYLTLTNQPALCSSIYFLLYYKNPYKRCKITTYKGFAFIISLQNLHYIPACFATSAAKSSSRFSIPSPVW